MVNYIVSENIYSLYRTISDANNGYYINLNHYEIVKNNHYLFPNTIFNVKTNLTNYNSVIKEMINGITINEYPNRIIAELNKNVPEFYEYFIKKGANIEIQAGMVLDLEKLSINESDKFVISQAKVDDLPEIANILSECFFENQKINESLVNILFNIPELTIWTAKERDKYNIVAKIVGTSMTYNYKDSIGLHFVGVPSRYRNQGIGRLVSGLTLKYSESNFKYSILRASNLGESIYSSLGFKEVTKFAIIS